jgi:hypothetical protein
MASDSLTHSHIWSEHFKIALLSQLYRWSYCDSLTISTYQAHLNLWMFPLYVSSGCALLTVEILWPDESLSVLPYKCFHMKHNTTGLAIPFLWHLAVVIRVLYSTFCYCSYDMWWYISSHELTRQSFIFTIHCHPPYIYMVISVLFCVWMSILWLTGYDLLLLFSIYWRLEDIRGPFEQFGPIKDVYLPRNFHTK